MRSTTHRMQEEIDQMTEVFELMKLGTTIKTDNEYSYRTVDQDGDTVSIIYAVDKIFETSEEFFGSDDFADVFGKTYANVCADQRRQWNTWEAEGSFKFIKGFKIGETMIKQYATKEGLNMLKKISIGAMMSNAPFDSVRVSEDRITIDVKNYANTKENRRLLQKHTAQHPEFTITTERF